MSGEIALYTSIAVRFLNGDTTIMVKPVVNVLLPMLEILWGEK